MRQEICSIEIASGRIRLRSIEMHLTYGGMIEGAPCRRVNDRFIERAVARAARSGLPVHLVPPTVTPLPSLSTREKWGPAEELPPVECIGQLDGPSTPRLVGDWWRTALSVVWYQQPSATVIHPQAVTQ